MILKVNSRFSTFISSVNVLYVMFFYSVDQGTVSKQVLPVPGAHWRLGVATNKGQYSV